MLLQLTTTHTPATDLGFLLAKNPARCQTFELPFGKAQVFYPEATPERCTAALLVEIDPVGLVRGRGPGDSGGGGGGGGGLDQYVNDRPYAASSFLSVALSAVFRSALAGLSRERPELTAAALPLKASLSAVPSRGGESLLHRLFEPLGYTLGAERLPLDSRFGDWGPSPYYRLTLEGNLPLRLLLSHLYVLLPVLDNDKHYWIGDEEVEKLLRHGGGWLPAHPERDLITRRYLKHSAALTGSALARLADGDAAISRAASSPEASELKTETDAEPESVPAVELPAPELSPAPGSTASEAAASEAAASEAAASGTTSAEPGAAQRETLNQQRLKTVLAALKATGAGRVLDLGCGEGKLLAMLLKEKQFTSILGIDVSHRSLQIAHARLKLDRLSDAWRSRIQLLQGSLIYRDERLAHADAAAVVEVIEHLDPPRLAAFERVVFGCARPRTVIITTPNREYNATWETLPEGKFRHSDHRFEWTRAEFQAWARRAAGTFGYAAAFHPVGPEDPALGSPTQMGIFTLLTGVTGL